MIRPPDRRSPAPGPQAPRRPQGPETPTRLIGHVLRSHGRWIFDPARRWRGGRRELIWHGDHAPEAGDYVIAEVPWDEGPARLVEVLGDDRPAWDDATVISQFRLRDHFPRAVTALVSHLRTPGEAERRHREDLRGIVTFTIDPEDARDHDDALSCTPLPGGRFEVGIHIADVSHYVPADSDIDVEARARGTSTYLPSRVVAMLPEALSNDVCSLRPGVDRLTLSVLAELDADGRVHRFRLAETVIHSRHKLHYEQVQAFLDGRVALDEGVAAPLHQLRELARALRAGRMARGALDLDVPEVKVWVDADGLPERIERRTQTESHAIVEEFMLLANRIVGGEGARRRAGLLYRVHEAPNPRKLEELDQVLRVLGLPRPGKSEDAAEALQAVLSVRLPEEKRRLLHRMVLRALARARYLERDIGHFGLATREYCHFTSPIRRYPDLHNHRRVREWIRGRPGAAWDPDDLARLASACSATEEVATQAEREAVRVKCLRHLEARLGEEASGIISGFVPQGFFVELSAVPVEGFVRVSLYLDDRFMLDPSGVRMVGQRTRKRFVLGDSIRVVIARVDVPARECDMALIEPRRRRGRRRG